MEQNPNNYQNNNGYNQNPYNQNGYNPNPQNNPYQNGYNQNPQNGYYQQNSYSPNYQNQGYYGYRPPYYDPQADMMRRQIEEKRERQKHELRIMGLALGLALIGYLVLQTVTASIIGLFGYSDELQNSAMFQNVATILSEIISVALPFGLMSLAMKKKYTTPLIPTEKVKPLSLWAWVATGMLLSLGANYVASAVSDLFQKGGYNASPTSTASPDSILTCILEVAAIAIVPPICEEFAMRCCSIGMLKKYGKGFAVLAVSIIFGIMHGNIVQIVFAFLVGLILGYVTVKTDSIVPAILIHGFNNGRSALNDIMLYATNEKIANTVNITVLVLWAVLGVASLVYLIIKKELLPTSKPEQQHDPTELSLGTKLLNLLPGLVIPFLILIAISIISLSKTIA